MSYVKTSILIVILICGYWGFGQKESINWYFGHNAGIRFTDTSLIALTDGMMDTPEGCASISNSKGNLLFYTDGVTVWNKNHNVMEAGLKGSLTSTQSAIIIPNPSGNNLYYIFTVDAITDGIQYSEVDISLNSGLGGVTSVKNQGLLTTALEKITAVWHDNQKDIWVIGHSKGTTAYYAYLITAAGVNALPYITNIGSNTGGGVAGYMKFSSSGTRMAAAHYEYPLRDVELFDFNKTTGKLSNLLKITNLDNQQPYGIEFSPSGNLLYVMTGNGSLFQYDLSASNILGSRVTIVDLKTSAGQSGALQLAPDGKIYIALNNSTNLSVIEKPNITGSGCQFKKDKQILGGKKSGLGLPSFIQSYFIISADFTADRLCEGTTTLFTSHIDQYDSLYWDFGDPANINNTSKAIDPKHKFTSKGTYKVTLTVFFKGQFNSSSQNIIISSFPVFNLGNDTSICVGQSVSKSLAFADNEVSWNDGTQKASRNFNTASKYIATVTANGCFSKDSFVLAIEPLPVIIMPDSAIICGNDSVYIGTNSSADSYLWNNGATTNKQWFNSVGTNSLTIVKSGCTAKKDLKILVRQRPDLNLGNDTVYCDLKGDIVIGISYPNISYKWNTGETASTIKVSKSGIYSVFLSMADCPKISDSIYLEFQQKPKESSTAINTCSDETLKISANTSSALYRWNTLETSREIAPNISGNYDVEVTNKCGIDTGFFDVIIAECNCQAFVANTITTNGDGLNELFGPSWDCNMETSYYRFSIYNTWGQLVAQSSIPGEQLDLSKYGSNIYMWTLDYKTRKYTNNIQKSLKGTVSVFR